MGEIISVLGQAGTGKTTWLMQQASELASSFLTADHHRLLAITRMHGSRRRLQLKLLDSCPTIPCSITTIDGFALSLLNRWRRSLGYLKPIQPVDVDTAFSDTILGTEAGFSHIMVKSTELLDSKTVREVIRESYPLVMIDEFQDCHGPLLDFVKALSSCSALILAADDFQLLDSNVGECPAVEWLRTTENGSSNRCTELTTCHRTSIQNILDAARCLRNNITADRETIPVICCPSHGPAAFKIIDALVFKASVWKGSTALICPSHDDFLQQVLNSCDSQLKKKNIRPIFWFHECAMREERKQLNKCLGIASQGSCSEGWTAPPGDLPPAASQVVSRTLRFSRLRGFKEIPHGVIARYVDTVVHERRAYSGHSPKRIVTTVHGAKNREFDNVIIIWPYTVPSDAERQKRLLYNAITRSKKNCMLLVRGNLKRAQNDSVLALLGPARDAFPPKKRKKNRSTKRKARVK
jgi:hypothetical protein